MTTKTKRKYLVKVEHPLDEIGSIFVELTLPVSERMEDLAIDTVKDGLQFKIKELPND